MKIKKITIIIALSILVLLVGCQGTTTSFTELTDVSVTETESIFIQRASEGNMEFTDSDDVTEINEYFSNLSFAENKAKTLPYKFAYGVEINIDDNQTIFFNADNILYNGLYYTFDNDNEMEIFDFFDQMLN